MSASNPSPLLIVISAPSGAGKSTLCQNFLRTRPGVSRAITCTTRPARRGECDGVDYYFLTDEEFDRRVRTGEFLEHAIVHGHRYGTLQREVLDRLAKGQDVLLTIDVQGADSVRTQAASDSRLKAALVSVFLTPPTMQELERRLRRRATDAEPVIQRRLAAAREELTHWDRFDFLVLSASPEEDLQRLATIADASKMRVGRCQAPVFE